MREGYAVHGGFASCSCFLVDYDQWVARSVTFLQSLACY